VPFTASALLTVPPVPPVRPGPRLRLGFACAWDANPVQTWSQTPWHLREALRRVADIVDLGIELPDAGRAALKLLHARPWSGELVSGWKHSRLWDTICHQTLNPRARRSAVAAVLEIQDMASLDVPYFLYQDASYDVLLHLWQTGTGRLPHFPMLDLDTIRRRAERQHRIFARASGVLAMSAWYARTLTEWSGVPAEKVHVVHPGMNAAVGGRARSRPAPRRQLLLVGKDFHTKGGEIVVAALALLSRELDPDITLTVAGPRRWPLPGPIPDGVRFLGRLPAAEIAALYSSHDLLVMPSRFEAFGIAFVEALASGLPCIGRRAFAMPELITPGHNGDLVDNDDPEALAACIARTLADDRLYLRCQSEAAAVAAHYTWDRAAADALSAVTSSLARLGENRLESTA
jgi:glycosyltransferase involved in cell wall biosynthesis